MAGNSAEPCSPFTPDSPKYPAPPDSATPGASSGQWNVLLTDREKETFRSYDG
eukprot:gene6929-16684_t